MQNATPRCSMTSGACLEEKLIQELAAGVLPPEQCEKHLGHLARCDSCATRLSRYRSVFSDELTPEEQALIEQLQSSSPEGQKAIVRKLLQESGWKSRIRHFWRRLVGQ
jgi:hypothetical protein